MSACPGVAVCVIGSAGGYDSSFAAVNVAKYREDDRGVGGGPTDMQFQSLSLCVLRSSGAGLSPIVPSGIPAEIIYRRYILEDRSAEDAAEWCDIPVAEVSAAVLFEEEWLSKKAA